MSGMTETHRIRIYFDTNVFIALLDSYSDVQRALLRLFQYGSGAPHQIITSELTLQKP
jgi:predicted nucleic acid-binding protein